MSNQSLLIDCNKIIKWLEQRKKLPNNWYNFSKAAQQKIKILFKSIDEYSQYPQLKQALTIDSQTMSYYDVCKFVQLLLQTDLANDKSLLFGYSDKRVKQWTNLKKFMESKTVGLISNAKYIEQSLKFDLPSLNKSIEMMDGQLGNLKRKIDFNRNTIFQQQNEMKKQINTVGLQVPQNKQKFNIESQIPNIVSKVPQTIQQIQNQIETTQIFKLFQIYKRNLIENQFQNQSTLLQHFLQFKNDYVDVFKGITQRSAYSQDLKYKQFQNWRAKNEWEIVIQIGDASKTDQQIELNYQTLLQNRQTRQQLLNNLNQLLFYFKGLKFTLGQKSNKMKIEDSQGSLGLTQKQLEQAVDSIQQVINAISHKKLLTPLQLKNNKKAYQHFISKFNNLEKNIQTLKDQIISYEEQIKQISDKREIQVQKLRKFRKNVVQVKKMQQNLLTQLIGGAKQVKIIGQINKLE